MIGIRERVAAGLKVGDTFATSRTFTNEDLIGFAQISRDYNPVHFDAEFAETKNFKAPICHGLLAGGLITELGGQIGWLASSMSFKFKGPVYVGETITCTMIITEIDQDQRARAAANLVTADGRTVIEAEITGIVPGDAERTILRRMLDEGDPTNGLAVKTGADEKKRTDT